MTRHEVTYYYKPPTKYPARIYVFMHAELWCDRNRRPMGLFNEYPFLRREMTAGEVEHEKKSWRLHYYQYERWDRVLEGERVEVTEMNKTNPGSGDKFLLNLMAFKNKFQLADIIIKPADKLIRKDFIMAQDDIRRSWEWFVEAFHGQAYVEQMRHESLNRKTYQPGATLTDHQLYRDALVNTKDIFAYHQLIDGANIYYEYILIDTDLFKLYRYDQVNKRPHYYKTNIQIK